MYILCSSVLDVVEKTLRHEGILVEVYQVWGLCVCVGGGGT